MVLKMSMNYKLAAVFSILLAVPAVTVGQGLVRVSTAGVIGTLADASTSPATSLARTDAAGFYGGIALRERGTDRGALSLGLASTAWSRDSVPAADDGARALVWGGYRWQNDLALEAAFSSREQYVLQPDRAVPAGRGVGLKLAGDTAAAGEGTGRVWNVDIFTSWSFYRSLALYGRMGYAQAETTSLYGPLPATDTRRARDGVNYGVGLRYDMNSALGLRLEYGRFGRFSTEFSGGLPDTDQVTFGVQVRF
jgi:hypothetical protein